MDMQVDKDSESEPDNDNSNQLEKNRFDFGHREDFMDPGLTVTSQDNDVQFESNEELSHDGPSTSVALFSQLPSTSNGDPHQAPTFENVVCKTPGCGKRSDIWPIYTLKRNHRPRCRRYFKNRSPLNMGFRLPFLARSPNRFHSLTQESEENQADNKETSDSVTSSFERLQI